MENSDTKKSAGSSKAAFVIQKSKLRQRAILFTVLNPNSDGKNGTCFAGFSCNLNSDLSSFTHIAIKCRGQGVNAKYKMLLNHDNIGKDAIVYGQIFSVILAWEYFGGEKWRLEKSFLLDCQSNLYFNMTFLLLLHWFMFENYEYGLVLMFSGVWKKIFAVKMPRWAHFSSVKCCSKISPAF